MPRGSQAHHGHAEQRDLYADLGVAKEATDAEIRRAYRELVLKVHPDKQGDAAEFRKVHAAYEVLRDPAQRQRYDARRNEKDHWEDEDEYRYDDSDGEFDFYHEEARVSTAWAEFIRQMQARARREPPRGSTYAYQTEESREWREFQEREAQERAEWKESEQKRFKAAQEIRQARAEEEKKLRMVHEEAARDNAIAQEDRLHEKHTKTSTKTKQAASRKNCTCQGCRDRFIREQSDKDQKKKDPEGYAERMKIREAFAALKETEAAKQAQLDAEREAKEQRAAQEAVEKKKAAQEKAAAEQAAREHLHQQLAEQEARQNAKEKAATEEVANRRRLEQLAKREAKREAKQAAERKANEAKKAAERKAKEAAELKARKAAERAAAEEAHRLAEQEAREATKREAAERNAKEIAERKARAEEEQKLKEAAQREAKERKVQEVAEQKAKAISERKAREAAGRKAKQLAEREAKEAAAREAKESAAQEAKIEEERSAQDAEEIDFGEAEERAAAEQVAAEYARREVANQNAQDMAKGVREITERMNALRRAEELARRETRDISKQDAIDMDRRQAHEAENAIAAQKAEGKAARYRAKQQAKEQAKQGTKEQATVVQQEVQEAPASERVQDHTEREVKMTVQQQTPVDHSAHGPHTQPVQTGGDWRAKIRCKYGERCKFLATGTCVYLHQDNTVANGVPVRSDPTPPQPAGQSPVVADVKPVENIAQHTQAKGEWRSKIRCQFGKNCKYFAKGTCVYRHTEAALAYTSVGSGAGQTPIPYANPPQGAAKPESTSQPDFAGFDTATQNLNKRFPESTDWQDFPSTLSGTVNRDTSRATTHTPSQPAQQKEQTERENAAPGLLKNLSQAVRLKISNNYIQTAKDGVILKLLEEGKHVPADGIAVDLGWVNAGYAAVCSFCQFKKLKYSFRCSQGSAVACGRCKKNLSTVTPEDEAVLLSAE
ncbi:hypothetical protein P171DRAFT_437332 [Karstenula rhodostoma CBS 690.94]|uniref:J domain-containing protein n=1 Tax=Karstenula rhodostoma CBS 690.94 TaxID=1392251 RepID=A0A9P4P7I3_9PLEO|nr:hypothetical protein P171DRAFT_437332 [Karstenula rhodostoma CBS 690.94]